MKGHVSKDMTIGKGHPCVYISRPSFSICNHLISYYSFIVYSPIWITLLYSKYFGLFLCERTLFVSFGIRAASSDPALGRTLLKLCLSRLLVNPFISELLRFQRFLTKYRLLAIQIFRVSLIILALDHKWAFSQTQNF